MGHHYPKLIHPDFSTRTFNKFIEGDCNRIARQAAILFAESVEPEFRQLYIQSEPGMGKSFLVRAIYNKLKTDKPQEKVIIVGGDILRNQIADAILSKRLRSLFRQYAKADVCLIEHIHLLADKVQIQSVLSELYDKWVNNSCRLVFTSNFLPNDLKGFDPGLISRLNQGLTVSIGHPDFATKLEILRSKTQELGFDLSEDSLTRNAQRECNSIRELVGEAVMEITKKFQ